MEFASFPGRELVGNSKVLPILVGVWNFNERGPNSPFRAAGLRGWLLDVENEIFLSQAGEGDIDRARLQPLPVMKDEP